MLPSFCNDSVAVLRPAYVERRGTTVADWANPTRTVLGGCSVQPADSVRDFEGRTLSVERGFDLYAPPNSDIRAGDRIEWGGSVFEVDGAPMAWRSPTGRVSHVQARLREWSG